VGSGSGGTVGSAGMGEVGAGVGVGCGTGDAAVGAGDGVSAADGADDDGVPRGLGESGRAVGAAGFGTGLGMGVPLAVGAAAGPTSGAPEATGAFEFGACEAGAGDSRTGADGSPGPVVVPRASERTSTRAATTTATTPASATAIRPSSGESANARWGRRACGSHLAAHVAARSAPPVITATASGRRSFFGRNATMPTIPPSVAPRTIRRSCHSALMVGRCGDATSPLRTQPRYYPSADADDT
jgi:hypothetical protein